MANGRALVADDDAGVRYTLTQVLEHAGLEVEAVEDGAAALERAREGDFDLIVSDLRMPKRDGLALLADLVREGIVGGRSRAKLVMVTAHGSERHAVEAMKLGAFDYLKKPFDMDEMLAVVERAASAARLVAENERLEGELNLSRSLLFESAAMSRLAILVRRVAPRDVTVLVTGESGTGKERVAEAIVRASKRADKPFVRFNCAAITPDLAEAELFGHAKGAFTGAHRARVGLFREAHGGTLLLDEVGELDLSVQAKLLRVLQESEVRPLGEDRPIKVDVRIIAATHRELAALVGEGRFRDDLRYRLEVVHLHVSPLRERREDIPILARAFLRRAAAQFGVPSVEPNEAFFDRLRAHPWPGNVRELENAIDAMIAMSPLHELDLSLLPDTHVSQRADEEPDSDASLKQRVSAYERGLLVAALAAARGNRSEAARALGVSRATMYEKMQKYGLD